MSDIIHLLPDAVANQIAAGEVIQRPASVVKELMENAIDAGATKIQVVVKDAGRTTIQVIDNGKGMSETDARMAFERHATSKITQAHDLFSLRTMGFRGEALASIAAISGVELRTRSAEKEYGTLIEIAASIVVKQESVSCDEGTSFLVKNLFYNVPARRKFLKSDDAEMRHIIQEFQRITLVYTDIHFELFSGTDCLYELVACNSRQRITALFGKKTRNLNQQLVQIEAKTALGNISGFVGKPEFATKTNYQYFFVNGRYMRHPYFHKAVMQAYERMLQPDTNPSYFIFFEIEPSEIDVNIHPTKTEIKFENERDLWRIVMICVKEALGKFNVTPSIDFDTEGLIDMPPISTTQHGAFEPPKVQFDPNYNPFKTDAPAHYSKSSTANWEKLYDNQKSPEIAVQKGLSQPLFDELVRTDVFQYKNRYLLTTVKSGLMIIDAQRAMERILFERVLHQLELQQCVSQQILFPEVLELTPDEQLLFQELLPDLRALGFDIEPFGKLAYVVNGVPALLTEEPQILAVLYAMLASVQEKNVRIHTELYESLAYEVAKSSAKNRQSTMAMAEMNQLIDSLFACQNPNRSPDGKTIITIMSDDELERRF